LAVLGTGGLLGTLLAGPLLRSPASAPITSAVPKELTSYRDVVKKVLPAVVSIEAKAKPAPRRPTGQGRLPAADPFGGFGPTPCQPSDNGDEGPGLGFGSGSLIDPKGVILTNHHVVEGASQVEVQLMDGRKFLSKDIKVDPKTDLAIVRLDAKVALPYL